MAERLTIEQVARYPRPGIAGPKKLRFRPDGKQVSYLSNSSDSLVQQLRAYDIESGQHIPLTGEAQASASQTFSREEELRRERSRTREVGVTDYEYAGDAGATVLLVPTGDGLMVRRGSGAFELLPDSAGAIAPKLSPDGSRVAYVREGELYVQDTAGGSPRKLTSGAERGITNGLAEFVAQEEMARAEGFWWSPDGGYLAYERVDERHIPIYPILHQGKSTVDVEEHAYPFAGAEN